MKIHQYVDRSSGQLVDEQLFGDRIVKFLYSRGRESAPRLFQAVTGARWTDWLGTVNFDMQLCSRLTGNHKFLERCGVDLTECVDDPQTFRTPRDVFERKIRFWDCRPMPEDPRIPVSPADSRIVIGSFEEASGLFLKEKFFLYDEMLGDRTGPGGEQWLDVFSEGDFAIFRLTPDKYHYNHTPVSGEVVDIYEISGAYHSCHPRAVVEVVTPYSKNTRVVTVIDTDVPNGTGVGRVAMVEIVAMMIGDIVQCYSSTKYADPVDVVPGLFVERGQPKSLYRPGSSTDVVIFEKGRVEFDADLIANVSRNDAQSHFTHAFGQSVVETDVSVRSGIARQVQS